MASTLPLNRRAPFARTRETIRRAVERRRKQKEAIKRLGLPAPVWRRMSVFLQQKWHSEQAAHYRQLERRLRNAHVFMELCNGVLPKPLPGKIRGSSGAKRFTLASLFTVIGTPFLINPHEGVKYWEFAANTIKEYGVPAAIGITTLGAAAHGTQRTAAHVQELMSTQRFKRDIRRLADILDYEPVYYVAERGEPLSREKFEHNRNVLNKILEYMQILHRLHTDVIEA